MAEDTPIIDEEPIAEGPIEEPTEEPVEEPEEEPEEETPVTTFQEMYDFFLAGITDDMFMELTKQDTAEMLEEILIAALP